MYLRFVGCMLLASAAMPAETRTGFLVDSQCYTSQEQNARQVDIDTNHDRDFEIRQCAPAAKSRSFAIVTRDGISYKLDPAANSRVVALLQSSSAKRPIEVTVEGSKSGNVLTVDSIRLNR